MFKYILLVLFSLPVNHLFSQAVVLRADTSKWKLYKKQPFLKQFQQSDSTAQGKIYRHPNYGMPVLVTDSTRVAHMPVLRPDTGFNSKMPVKKPGLQPATLSEMNTLNVPGIYITPPNRQ